MGTALYLIGAVLLILTNTFFVATEFALVTVSQTFLNGKAEDGDKRAILALSANSKLPRYLAGAQLGITISTLALGFLAEPAVARLFDLVPFISYAVAAALALVLVTFIQMVVGEIVPKNLALSDPDKAALLLARPHHWFVIVLNPIIWVIDKITAFGVRALGVSGQESKNRTPVELVGVVDESLGGGVIDKFEHDLLTGAIDLGRETVGRNMTLRPRIVSVKRNSKVEDIEKTALDSGHSRLPVITASNIIGFVHANDLLAIADQERSKEVPENLIRPVLKLEVSCPLDEALVSMQQERCHLAIVFDKRKNILGLITMEDVLESLVGDFPED